MMRIKQKIILGVTLLYLFSGTAFPAEKVSIEKNKRSAVNKLNNLSRDYTFKLDTKADVNGSIRFRLAEHYKGIKVWDSSVMSTKVDIRRVTDEEVVGGNFVIELEDDVSDVTPTLSENDAIAIALQASNTLIYDSSSANAELLIHKDESGKAGLIYKVDYFTDEIAPSRPFTLVDAHTGRVLRTWEGLTTADAKGPGGNEKTGKYNYGTEYGPLIVKQAADGTCTMDSPNVSTWDLRGAKTGEILHKFNCFENTYKQINGAYSPINDAHYFGNVVYDMYKEWFKTEPLKFKLKMRVHYDVGYDNAFWDGRQMTFGDGARMFYPLVAQDVVGHEVSHGFTEQNSGLVYQNQSGAINESFSDMAGQATQFFSNKNKPEGVRNDWLVGDDITKGPRGKAMRYFDDPTKDGHSIGHAKDYYRGMEVHSSSGVFNRAFYILGHKSGWNTKKAFEVFVWANQLHWTANTTFDEAACGVSTVAADAGDGYSKADVIDAFKAVGVDATCGEEQPEPNPDPDPNPNPDPDPNPNPDPDPDPNPTPDPDPNPNPDPNPCPCPNPEPYPNPTPCPSPYPSPYPFPDPYPSPYPSPYPFPDPYPSPYPSPNPFPWPFPDWPFPNWPW